MEAPSSVRWTQKENRLMEAIVNHDGKLVKVVTEMLCVLVAAFRFAVFNINFRIYLIGGIHYG